MENPDLSDLVLSLQTQLIGLQVRVERLEKRDVAHTTIGMLHLLPQWQKESEQWNDHMAAARRILIDTADGLTVEVPDWNPGHER